MAGNKIITAYRTEKIIFEVIILKIVGWYAQQKYNIRLLCILSSLIL